MKYISYLLIMCALLLGGHTAHAAYRASDVLGQFTATGTPTFDANNENNFTSPNAQGFNYPQGAALDSVGHKFFVSDCGNNRVLVYNLDSNNNLNDHVADYVLGQSDFVSGLQNQGGSLSSRTINCSSGLNFDVISKRLFVTDGHNSRILIFDLTNGITNGMAASYVLGQSDFASGSENQGGSIASTTVGGPVQSEYDSSSQRLFVSDAHNSRILIYDLSNGITNGMHASYALGQPDLVSGLQNQGGLVSSTTISNPFALAYDGVHQRLFVDDDGNSRILVFSLSGSIFNDMPPSYVIGQPNFVSTSWSSASSTSVGCPEELAYDSNHDRLFAGDDCNNRILSFELSGGITNGMAASHVLGQPDFTSDDYSCNPSNDTICDPELGMVYDVTNNHLWMTDNSNNRVLVWDMSNGITNNMPASDVLGQTDGVDGIFATSDGDNEHANRVGMSYPQGFFLDSVGHKFFVSDCGNNRVLVYNLDSNNDPIDYVADHVIGQSDFISNQVNQGGSMSSSSIGCAGGMSYDSVSSRLFIPDSSNNRVLIYDLSHGITNGMPASYVIGQPNFISNSSNQGGSVSSTTLSNPADSVYDSVSSRLFAADSNNNRVLIYDLSHGITNGMPASYVIGQPDFVSRLANQGGSVSSTTDYAIFSLSYDDQSQRLFVTDTSNNRVLVYDLSNGIINGMSASYVLGQTDFVSNQANQGGGVSSTTMGVSYSNIYDSAHDKLFVSDVESNRLLVYDLTNGITNGMEASAVIGQADFAGNNWDCNTSIDTICDSEFGMSYDAGNNRLWITDNSNNRVLSFEFVKLPSITTTGTVGTTYSSSVTATQSQGTVSYAVTSGSLPSGISLNTSTGALAGIPLTAGVFTFSIKATDDNGAIGIFTDTKSYTITVGAASTPAPSGSSHSSSGGSVSASVLAQILAPSASTAAFLKTYNTPANTPALPPSTFTRSLQAGSNGLDVKALQKYLNTHGFPVTLTGLGSTGHETTYFGPATRVALIKFQKANKISPAIGFFGPVTRGYVK